MSAVTAVTVTAVTADEINREHDRARRHAGDAIKHAIRCGELLIQKKAELPHGTFTLWVARNCKFKQAMANNYMKAAQTPNALGNSIRHLFPSGRPQVKAAMKALVERTPAEPLKIPLPKVAGVVPIASPETSCAVDIPDDVEKVEQQPTQSHTRLEAPRQAADRAHAKWHDSQATARDLNLQAVKTAINEYGAKYGWGAVQMDIGAWIEDQVQR